MNKLLLCLILLCGSAWAQGSFYQLAVPMPNASVRVCPIQTANPCPSPSSIFNDSALTQSLANPFPVGPTGNFGFWIASGQYTVQIGQPYNLSFNINLGGSGGGGLADPGSNGVLKRTAVNVTAVSTSADLIALWSGTCNVGTFLRGDGACAAAGGSGTVNANNGVVNAIATYAAAGGSTTVGPAANTACIPGATSGSSCLSAPAVAGTATNPITISNIINLPNGTNNAPSVNFVGAPTAGLYLNSGQAIIYIGGGGTDLIGLTSLTRVPSNGGYTMSSTGSASGSLDTGMTRPAAGVVAIGNGTSGDESGLLRWNQCRVTGDITLPVNTATTVCTWSLPAVAKAWAWQCEVPWVISAGTGTNTLAIIANPSQTPTGTTNGFAEILTTNTGTATEQTTALSASGGTTLLTSPTITPAATVFSSRTSGTLLASGTAGTFAIQMTAAGTTATAAAKAGATCLIY